MRTLVSLVAVALGVGLAGAAAEQSAAPLCVDATQISQLISLLGSKQYKEREAATQSLNTVGLLVLEELQKAKQSENSALHFSAEKLAEQFLEGLRRASQDKDPEVRRRAEILAQQAQRRLDGVNLLEPKRVEFVCRDAPLSEAIAQFEKVTGFSFQLTPPPHRGGVSSPKITLDTGKTTFWDAFDQFCQRARLVEAPVAANNEQVVRVWNGNGAARVQAVVIANPYQTSLGTIDGRINLREGNPAILPTCYSGPVRFRAVPVNVSAWGRGKEEILFVLEVTPQPKMAWQGVVDLHIDRASDDHGQSLAPSIGADGTASTVAGQNGAVFWDSDLSQGFDPRQVPVRLKSGDRPSKMLREVKGSIAAQLETPPQPLLTIHNIVRSVGKTVRGLDGEAVKVIEAKQAGNGTVKLRLRVDNPPQEMLGRFNGRLVIRGNMAVARKGFIAPGGAMIREPSSVAANLKLLDAQGQSFDLIGTETEMVADGNGMSQEIQLSYRASQGQGEAAKLIYSGRRTVVIDVPFTLKDVPLP